MIQAPNTATHHRIRVTWTPPNVGTVSGYLVYRALGATINGSSAVELVCDSNPATVFDTCPSGSATSFVDLEELPFAQDFTYFMRAVFSNCNPALETCQSGPSNFATVPTVNDAPVANNDPSGSQNFTTFLTTPLTIAARGVLVNDTDADSPPVGGVSRIRVVIGLTTQPLDSQGIVRGSVVLNADGSFVYTPPGDFDGVVRFTYKADDGTWRTPTGPLMSAPSTLAGTVTVTIDKKKK